MLNISALLVFGCMQTWFTYVMAVTAKMTKTKFPSNLKPQ